MPDEPRFANMYQMLTQRYDLEELRTLCAQIGVDFDDLRGEGKSAKARELILFLQRRGRLAELEAILQNVQSAEQRTAMRSAQSLQPEHQVYSSGSATVGQEGSHHVRILHISDIHRAPKAPISNTFLLGNLLDDIRYTYDKDNAQIGPGEPKLGPPDLIVVSGDLTQHADEIEFKVALSFLEGLLPLVNGDRRRIVLVPGNHDVNWEIAARSYTPATKEDSGEQATSTIPFNPSVKRAPDGSYWHKNETTYTDRFKPFKTFFEVFYQGTYQYSSVRDEMFTVYDLVDPLGLVAVGFNSCDEIDAYPLDDGWSSLDRRAFINTDAIFKARQSLDFHADQAELLRIAVFHHNIRAVNYMEDFLDPKYLSLLKRQGFELCLHGHVHTASHDLFDATQAESLPVVGAGSLAAPYHDRPPASPIGYNLMVIDRRSGGIWVHTRRHDENNLVWAADYQWSGKPYFVVRPQIQEAAPPPTPGVIHTKVQDQDPTSGSRPNHAGTHQPQGACLPTSAAGGIPSTLYSPLKQALLDCGPLETDDALRAVFVDGRLKPWRHKLPQASNPTARAEAVIAFLVDQRHVDTGENVLVILLRVLSKRHDPAEECHSRLVALANELENALGGRTSTARHSVPTNKSSGGLDAAPSGLLGRPVSSSAGTSTPILDAEIASLRRQLAKLKRNLLTIEERMTDFIDPRSVPPDLAESEKLTRERIADIEARLAELET